MSDLISRQTAMNAFLAELARRERNNLLHTWTTADVKYFIADILEQLPTVDADEFEWCHDCKEYNQNAHCCHRWTKVISNTVNDLKTQGYEPVKHGYWVENDEGDYHCSVCNAIVESDEKSRHYWGYCYHCGAKMDGGDAE